jgi:hypothetical protein
MKKDKEDNEGDKSEAQGYEHPVNVINIIFGGDSNFSTKRAQKLTLHEIMAIGPTIQRPLRHSFSQLFQAGKIPARTGTYSGRLPTHTSNHRRWERPQPALREYFEEDGARHHQHAHPSKTQFYGIIPGNSATPIGSVTLPVTFRTKENYSTEYVKFEVAIFESSYHTILGRPALAKFMAVPHYVYLLLKMSGKTGVLMFHGDMKRSYDCDQEAIECASITRVLDASTEVFVAAQQLPQSEMVIPTTKSCQSLVKPTSDVNVKAIHLQEGDPSKTALIGTGLGDKSESMLVSFL